MEEVPKTKTSPIIQACGEYAQNNSLGVVLQRSARVVTLDSLKAHLESKNLLNLLPESCETIEEFLKQEHAIAPLGEWWSWFYEICTAEEYRSDPRVRYRFLSELPAEITNDTKLFLCNRDGCRVAFSKEYAARNKPMKASEELSREVLHTLKHYKMKETMANRRRALKNRMRTEIDELYPGCNIKVFMFGSSANGLSLKESDLDLTIVVPPGQYEADVKNHWTKIYDIEGSIYNMKHIASLLTNLGMERVEPVCNALVPICRFYDPVTEVSCDLSVQNTLGLKNTQLIHEYVRLDARVEPFLIAIKHFVKQKNINKTIQGTMSSYAYIILALCFLMQIEDKPLLPCLQKLPGDCEVESCHWNRAIRTPALYHRRMFRCDVRFHTCAQIKNLATSDYKPFGESYRTRPTVWESKNDYTYSTLLIEFFRFVTQEKELILSPIAGQTKELAFKKRFEDATFVIQDPFLLEKNLAETCTPIGHKAIRYEFERALRLLEQGYSFEYICDPQYNFERPIDHYSVEYKQNMLRMQPSDEEKPPLVPKAKSVPTKTISSETAEKTREDSETDSDHKNYIDCNSNSNAEKNTEQNGYHGTDNYQEANVTNETTHYNESSSYSETNSCNESNGYNESYSHNESNGYKESNGYSEANLNSYNEPNGDNEADSSSETVLNKPDSQELDFTTEAFASLEIAEKLKRLYGSKGVISNKKQEPKNADFSNDDSDVTVEDSVVMSKNVQFRMNDTDYLLQISIKRL
ncbi:hypothetical protein BY458DRAFT_497389 [Sporodiniella umbellata]|nr:hypothetical protein BY458DRAFT_497389 [Sporodiniella umbellata]